MARLRERAKSAKAAKALSIADLVMASGLSRTAVLDMLNGRGRVVNGRLDSWWALAWALDIPFGELMGALDQNSGSATQTALPPP
jgi:transcriptional regulator with XRE-family HTH domain